jgi:hypothetical protein
LIVVVVIAVLTVLGFALLKFGSSENEAVASKRHYDRAVSCADAAKEMLLSQFRTYGVSPLDIQVNRVIGDQRAGTGHYDQIGQPTVTLAEGFKKTTFGASDISNRIVRTGLGGQVYRMTVACSDSSDATHQSEVEFVVRFGL